MAGHSVLISQLTIRLDKIKISVESERSIMKYFYKTIKYTSSQWVQEGKRAIEKEGHQSTVNFLASRAF